MRLILTGLAVLFISCANVTAQYDSTFVSGINLENVQYPFPVKFITINVQGESLKMAYMDVKPQTPKNAAVLLLHGKNFCGAYWEETAKKLSAEGYRVIIPDQIGFGKSSKPLRIQYSFQLLAGNTRMLLDSLKIERVAVLGHSMGGMLATRFALMYPNMVMKLILENPIGLEDWKLHVPYQKVDDWYGGELQQNYEKMKQYQLRFYYDNKWEPEYDRWLGMIAGWTKNIDYPRIAWNSALHYDMIFTQPVLYEFGNLTMPVLLIIGQRDRTALGKNRAPADVRGQLGNYPRLGRQTAAAIKKSTLVELDNVGHLPHIESFARFIAPLLDFLEK